MLTAPAIASEASARAARIIGYGVIAAAAVALLVMPLLRFASLHSSFFDLGQYAVIEYSFAVAGSWSAVFRTHAQIPIALYGPLFALVPSNATLLVLQSGVLIASAGLFALYWRKLGLKGVVAPLLLCVLSFPIWFSALFDFHFEHLLFPLLFGFFLLMLKPDTRGTQLMVMATALALCLVKEVYPLSAAMLGLYLMIARRWVVTGLAIVVLSLAYFFVATRWVIPYFSDGRGTGELWGNAFGYLGTSIGEIVTSVAKRPWLVVSEIISAPRKILYVFALFAAMAFLPLRAPLVLLPTLPLFAIALLSRNENHFYLGHQYTAAICATLLVGTAQALAKLQPQSRSRAVAAAIGTSALTLMLFGPAPISRLFWSDFAWGYHWSAYWPSARDARVKERVAQLVPAEDRWAVSVQNSLNLDRLSARAQAFGFPDAALTPVATFPDEGPESGAPRPKLVRADYVVLDRRRPIAMHDRICRWEADGGCKDVELSAEFDKAVAALAHDYELLDQMDGLFIFRRRALSAQ